MNFKALILAILSAFILTACSGGEGKGSQSEASDAAVSGSSKLSMVAPKTQYIPKNGRVVIPVTVTQLKNDDPVYFSVSSSDIDTGRVTVTPENSVLNPSSGNVAINLTVEDHDLIDSADLMITLTTAGNHSVAVETQVNLGD